MIRLTLIAVAHNREDIIKRFNLVFDWAEMLAKDSAAKDSAREPAIRLLSRGANRRTTPKRT